MQRIFEVEPLAYPTCLASAAAPPQRPAPPPLARQGTTPHARPTAIEFPIPHRRCPASLDNAVSAPYARRNPIREVQPYERVSRDSI